jgi:hypothetical protein
MKNKDTHLEWSKIYYVSPHKKSMIEKITHLREFFLDPKNSQRNNKVSKKM